MTRWRGSVSVSWRRCRFTLDVLAVLLLMVVQRCLVGVLLLLGVRRQAGWVCRRGILVLCYHGYCGWTSVENTQKQAIDNLAKLNSMSEDTDKSWPFCKSIPSESRMLSVLYLQRVNASDCLYSCSKRSCLIPLSWNAWCVESWQVVQVTWVQRKLWKIKKVSNIYRRVCCNWKLEKCCFQFISK